METGSKYATVRSPSKPPIHAVAMATHAAFCGAVSGIIFCARTRVSSVNSATIADAEPNTPRGIASENIGSASSAPVRLPTARI